MEVYGTHPCHQKWRNFLLNTFFMLTKMKNTANFVTNLDAILQQSACFFPEGFIISKGSPRVV